MTDREWGVWCVRMGGSVCGAAETWARDKTGRGIIRTSEEEAKALAKKWNEPPRSAYVYYQAMPLDEEV